MKPSTCYFICATPRTGSTLLCDILKNSGVAGFPEEYFEFLKDTGLPRQPIEYFDLRDEFLLATKHAGNAREINTDRLYLWSEIGYRELARQFISERRTRNNVFGSKMMWGYFGDFVNQMFSSDMTDALTVHRDIESFFPNIKYVWMRRNDKILQAISLWKAIQSQCWRSDYGVADNSERTPLKFNCDAISFLIKKLIFEDECWAHFFRESFVSPIIVEYDLLSKNPKSVAKSVILQLGLNVPPNFGSNLTSMRRQYDATSERWLRQFKASPAADQFLATSSEILV